MVWLAKLANRPLFGEGGEMCDDNDGWCWQLTIAGNDDADHNGDHDDLDERHPAQMVWLAKLVNRPLFGEGGEIRK